mgnify:CR=1 FL=1
MPRYRYVCEVCEFEQMKLHLSNESPKYFCSGCYVPAQMTRALTTPHITKEQKEEPTKVGQLTKEYIESNKQILDNIIRDFVYIFAV